MIVDPIDDGWLSLDQARKVIHERRVRSGHYPPRDDNERRQQAEGPRATRLLDCVREAKGQA